MKFFHLDRNGKPLDSMLLILGISFFEDKVEYHGITAEGIVETVKASLND
jgi:hypothetical protein